MSNPLNLGKRLPVRHQTAQVRGKKEKGKIPTVLSRRWGKISGQSSSTSGPPMTVFVTGTTDALSDVHLGEIFEKTSVSISGSSVSDISRGSRLSMSVG